MTVATMTTTHEENLLVIAITARAERELGALDALGLAMDLALVHSHGVRLDLERLLHAPRFEFISDIAGLQLHVDRRTGALAGGFTPFCVARAPQAAA